ncbi:hypothetical protein JNB71_03365 [Rhizobium herbae]|uniref:Uncharacterized protein n=1 Tax=Rhizobium herbae TaxID=508661 RepID=A0ABS7H5G1_9HYPH|nr:hypothetical protein [Rhizobium herbae]MBW9062350.1 hypothetical protein [Rhizobium herbae]
MDLSILENALALAGTAISTTGKAASTAEAIKKLFSSDKAPDASEAMSLVNKLAVELTAANVMNLDLSGSLKQLSQELKAQDEFEQEKARYQLVTTSQGDMVYKLREDMANGDPMHFVCPACLKKDRLIVFIQGEGDYKRCQVNHDHLYTFGRTEYRSNREYNSY